LLPDLQVYEQFWIVERRILKKYILAAALVLASTSAMADRTVSGSSTGRTTKAAACNGAKVNAESQVDFRNEAVDSYSTCDCDQDKHGDWSCSVDAKLEDRPDPS
jgi:hypothetical protein